VRILGIIIYIFLGASAWAAEQAYCHADYHVLAKYRSGKVQAVERRIKNFNVAFSNTSLNTHKFVFMGQNVKVLTGLIYDNHLRINKYSSFPGVFLEIVNPNTKIGVNTWSRVEGQMAKVTFSVNNQPARFNKELQRTYFWTIKCFWKRPKTAVVKKQPNFTI